MKTTRGHFVICINNIGYESSLEIRKLYPVLPDREAQKHRQIRVIDETGEDYLYSEKLFASVRLPVATQQMLKSA